MALQDKTPAFPASAGYQGVPLSEPKEKHPREVSRLSSAVPVALRGPRKKFDRIAADPASSYSSTAEVVEEEEPATGLTSLSSVHVHASDSATVSELAFDPMSISWHAAFLADDLALNDQDPVATWADSSGNGRDMGIPTFKGQPTYHAAHAGLGGQPAVAFDGIDDRMATAQFPAALSVFTVVAVGFAAALGGANTIFTSTHDASAGGTPKGMVRASTNWEAFNGTLLSDGAADTSKHLFIATFNYPPSGDDKVELNGVTIMDGDAGASTATGVQLGGFQSSNNSTARVAFVAIYDGELTEQQKAGLLAWAQEKYGTP